MYILKAKIKQKRFWQIKNVKKFWKTFLNFLKIFFWSKMFLKIQKYFFHMEVWTIVQHITSPLIGVLSQIREMLVECRRLSPRLIPFLCAQHKFIFQKYFWIFQKILTFFDLSKTFFVFDFRLKDVHWNQKNLKKYFWNCIFDFFTLKPLRNQKYFWIHFSKNFGKWNKILKTFCQPCIQRIFKAIFWITKRLTYLVREAKLQFSTPDRLSETPNFDGSLNFPPSSRLTPTFYCSFLLAIIRSSYPEKS